MYKKGSCPQNQIKSNQTKGPKTKVKRKEPAFHSNTCKLNSKKEMTSIKITIRTTDHRALKKFIPERHTAEAYMYLDII